MKCKQAFVTGALALTTVLSMDMTANATGVIYVPTSVHVTPAHHDNTVARPTSTPNYRGRISDAISGTKQNYYSAPKTITVPETKTSSEKIIKVDYSNFKGKPYYSEGLGFATGLMTSGGVYLLLDTFSPTGDPVYINADTGQPVNISDIDKEQVSVVDNKKAIESETTDETAPTGVLIFMIGLLAFVLGGLAYALARSEVFD